MGEWRRIIQYLSVYYEVQQRYIRRQQQQQQNAVRD